MYPMINEKFVLIGALLNIIGSSTYAYNTFKGKTKPNRVTWFLWALAPLIAFSAELGQDVGLRSIMTFMVGFGPLMVFIASFLNRKAFWQITPLDIFCGCLSVAALILWILTRVGNIAIILSIASDLLASVPTIIKSYRQPETEHPSVFRNGALSAGITLLTVKSWTLANYGFPLYILLDCLILYALIRFMLGTRNKVASKQSKAVWCPKLNQGGSRLQGRSDGRTRPNYWIPQQWQPYTNFLLLSGAAKWRTGSI